MIVTEETKKLYKEGNVNLEIHDGISMAETANYELFMAKTKHEGMPIKTRIDSIYRIRPDDRRRGE